ncbi:SIL1 factor, partial [Columbina picui]|nr:SIL1 factor [Columbina picui]
QAVPAGSHVRLNLQTGEREAKLPDREHEKSSPCKSGAGVSFCIFPVSMTCLHLWVPPSAFKAHEEEVRKKFRPIEQLKEEFEKLNVKMETDYEIMVKLISKFNSSASTLEEKVAALYDLEYYVHQV